MFILKGHKEPVQSVEFSRDQRALLSVTRDGILRVWDLATRELVSASGHRQIYRGTFTPDARAVIAHDVFGAISLWDAATGGELPLPGELAAHKGFRALTFSPDGRRLVASNMSDDYGIHQWEWPGGTALPTLPGSGAYREFKSLLFSPDGAVLAGLNREGIHVYDVASGVKRTFHRFDLTQDEGEIAYSPDGRQVAVASGVRLAVLVSETGERVAEMRIPRKFFQQVAFTPDGRFLITVSNEETAKIWDAATWQLTTELAWEVGALRCLAISPDGALAAAGGMGRKVVVWDLDY